MNTRALAPLALFFLFALRPGAAHALELHGSVRNSSAIRTSSYGDRNHDWLNLETALRLEGTRATANGKNNFFGKVDFKYDYIAGRGDMDIRELYMDHFTRRADFRIGKQIITWGSSDLIFVTDVFPKDWKALIAGRPMEYLKTGVEAARAEVFFKKISIETILISSFTPDTLPGGGRLAAFNPFPSSVGAVTTMPPNRLRSPEAALALKKNAGAYDYSLNWYAGRDRRPALSYDAASGVASQRFPRMWMLGGGFKGASGANVYRGEIAYYHTEDTSGADSSVQNASLKYLGGMDKTLGGNRAVSFQFGQEITFDYGAWRRALPPGAPAPGKTQSFASFRFTDAWKYQTIKPKLFALYNFSMRDYYIAAEYERSLNDSLSATLGVNLFGGKHGYTMYGQFDKNDNIYLNAQKNF